MLMLGLILILVGAALLYFFQAEPVARFIGAVLAVIGLVLVILAVADAGDLSLDDNDHGAVRSLVA